MEATLKVTVGTLTVEMPTSFVHEGETVELGSYDIRPVYDEHAMPGEEPVGFNLRYEASGQGTVVNGIYSNSYGETIVCDGPLDEPDEYESIDDAPYDTHFMPPDEFVSNVSVYYEEEEFDDEEDGDEE